MNIRAADARSASLAESMNDAVRFRTAGVLAILLTTAVLNLVRIATAPDTTMSEVPIGVPMVIGGLIVYEAVVLGWLRRRRPRDRPLSTGWVYANAFIESAAPTVLILLVPLGTDLSLRAATTGPAVHLYAIFIVLSVLHVRMRVALVAGATAGLGLALVVGVSVVWEGEVAGPEGALPQSLAFLTAVLVVCTGVAAGLVALRVRRYLESAASETQKRMRAERDLQAAAVIQQKLMPADPPDVAGFEVVGWNRPADETGGDYFDWVPLDDGRCAVCIADVTGHGLGPAMITCFCRAYARSALRVESRIAAALGRLNTELLNDLGDGRFVTFAAVVITPDNDRVLSVSAGHGPLLVHRRRDGSVESFGADTLPLGVTETEDDVEAVSHELPPGDTFLLLTDGFFEWANRTGEQFGTQRLRASLARHGNEPGQSLIDGLLADVEAFAAGTPQPDDLTAVVIRRIPTESPERT